MARMRKGGRIRAFSTVEAAFVMSVVLLTVMLILFAGLYLHDKNVLAGAADETAQIAKEWKRMEENKSAEGYFQDRIRGKLLYFSSASCSVERRGEEICVRASASSVRMQVHVSAYAFASEPEEDIRKLYSM